MLWRASVTRACGPTGAQPWVRRVATTTSSENITPDSPPSVDPVGILHRPAARAGHARRRRSRSPCAPPARAPGDVSERCSRIGVHAPRNSPVLPQSSLAWATSRGDFSAREHAERVCRRSCSTAPRSRAHPGTRGRSRRCPGRPCRPSARCPCGDAETRRCRRSSRRTSRWRRRSRGWRRARPSRIARAQASAASAPTGRWRRGRRRK